MAKLQPNFSWQAFQADTQERQFQYQLQKEHILVANAINATIDDASFLSKQRQTSDTWIDGKLIYKKTISGIIVGTATTAYPHGIEGIDSIVRFEGSAQDAKPSTVMIPLPYVNPNVLAAQVGMYVDQTNLNIITGNATFNGYTFNVTLYYTLGS